MRKLMTIGVAAMTMLAGVTAMADDDWGPFVGPWVRYEGNPISSETVGPQGIVHFKDGPNNPLLSLGPEGAWDSKFISQECVVKEGDWWYMMYSGQSTRNENKDGQSFGLARAKDLMGPWERYLKNPVFTATGDGKSWDCAFVQHPCLVKFPGGWRLYYNGHGTKPLSYQQGVAFLGKPPRESVKKTTPEAAVKPVDESAAARQGEKSDIDDDTAMKLWKKVPLGKLSGGFVMPADLTGDGQADLLMSYPQKHSAHLRLVAMDLHGKILWSHGDASVTGKSGSNPLRAPLTAFDFDGDGKTEVVAEFWNDGKPRLVMLAGATGEVLHEISSPFDMSVRDPKGYKPSRPSPLALVAHLDGPDKPASVVLKYEASGTLPPLAVAYDHKLNKRWEVRGRPWSEEEQRGADMGHQAIVTDLTGDGRDDVVFGQMAVDSDGKTIFRRDLEAHADGVDVFMQDGEKRIVLTLCKTGPAYCLNAKGKTVWQKTQQEVPHGQAGWAGNFLPERPELEIIMLVDGHYGIFHTFAAEDGRKLAAFEHHSGIKHANGSRKYPDMPVKVRWRNGEDSLWVPVDRMILNGRGDIVAELGEYDGQVVGDLHPGTSKSQVAVQAVPVDLCGDAREELLLFQPYQGKAVFIFTQPDSDGQEKPYIPQSNAYNRRAYF